MKSFYLMALGLLIPTFAFAEIAVSWDGSKVSLIGDGGDVFGASIVVTCEGGLVQVVNQGSLAVSPSIPCAEVRQFSVRSGGVNDAVDMRGITKIDFPLMRSTSMVGGLGNDSFYGTPFRDSVNLGSGNDSAFGYAGNDRLIGSSGNDSLNGGRGDDTLSGGSGNDVLKGGPGSDTFISSSGLDVIRQ